MSRRTSIDVAGYGHQNPIPAASRIGNLVMSGVITGRDPDSGTLPPTLEEQCANMFGHVRRIVEAAGGSPEDIIKITVWLKDPAQRGALNAEWLRLFPEPASRPARHTLRATDGDALVSCDLIAFLS